ncbi:MAG: hypothetical protein HC834_06900 [Rhodospirillales bacterium]|nr:hypothetical protein [Rhodospirillales bacterium]
MWRMRISQPCSKRSQRSIEKPLHLRFDWKAFDLREIAAATGVPVGTVKSRLHHALGQLRRSPRTRKFSRQTCPTADRTAGLRLVAQTTHCRPAHHPMAPDVDNGV